LKAAREEHKKAMEDRAKMLKLQSKFMDASRSGDAKKIVAAVEEIAAEVPSAEQGMFGLGKLGALVNLDEQDKALEYAEKLSNSPMGKNAQGLNGLAWTIVDPASKGKPNKKLLEFALKTAQRADELADSKDAGIADTLAKAYFDSGDTAKAVEHQERAVRLAKGSPYEGQIGELKDRLEKYKAAAK
jgi:tetratricopeptide (TPR) repeat protein